MVITLDRMQNRNWITRHSRWFLFAAKGKKKNNTLKDRKYMVRLKSFYILYQLVVLQSLNAKENDSEYT